MSGAVTIGDDGIVRFTHPLLASAVYAELASSERRSVHARLAHVARDLEERARHLALSTVEPDAAVAALLDEAAARAFSRGAPEAAVELAQEAVALTPTGNVSDREERDTRGRRLPRCRPVAMPMRLLVSIALLAGPGSPDRGVRGHCCSIGPVVEHDLEA